MKTYNKNMEQLKSAKKVREKMKGMFVNELTDEILMEIITEAALELKTSVTIPLKDYDGLFLLLRDRLNSLGYEADIIYYVGFPKEKWQLVISWDN